jgi:Phage integrase, N-terminal SAM-like domain
MATIEKRVRNGKTTYRVRYRDPAGSQRSRVFARKADAQRFLNETETAKARGTWTDPALGRVLFRDWLGEWWATTTNLRPKTRDRDELLLRRLALPSFGAVPLAAISQRDVRAWVADLTARGLAPATVQKAYQLLGKVMGAAVDAGMLAQSPCRRVPLPKVEREEMRFLTPAEVATLARAAGSRRGCGLGRCRPRSVPGPGARRACPAWSPAHAPSLSRRCRCMVECLRIMCREGVDTWVFVTPPVLGGAACRQG